MKKSLINPMPMFFDRYINIVEEDDLFVAFDKSQELLQNIDINAYKKVGNNTYEPGKWTIKDILQHIVDNERIQSYRDLRIARRDTTPLPGYEENLLADNAYATDRDLNEIMDELNVVRKSTLMLFKSFNQSVFNATGTCFNQTISVTALGFNIIGHQQHHLKVIEQKYLSL